jgi:hypothetical protein
VRAVARLMVAGCLCGLGMTAACAALVPSEGAAPPERDRVFAAPAQVVVRFPVTTTDCGYHRLADARRIYMWLLHVGEGNPRHVVEVTGSVPDSLPHGENVLPTILPYLKAGVFKVGGEPMMTLADVDTTARVAAEGDTVLVVRVTARRAIAVAFASRPRTAAMHACGEDTLRRVGVRYEPGF